MSAKNRLGRGLDSLIPTSFDQLDKSSVGSKKDDLGKVQEIAVEQIKANPDQPRTEFDEKDLVQLSQSIKQHGIIQPLVAYKSGSYYQLIAGERRLRAAKLANLEKVPVIVRSVNKQQQLEVAIVENVQRSDLSPLELANAYMQLNTQFNLSYGQIAEKVGKAESSVVNIIRLLNLVYEAKKALAEGRINVSHAKALVSTTNPQKQLAMLEVILKNKLNSQATEELARRVKKQNLPAHKAAGVHSYNQDVENRLTDYLSTKVNIRKTARGGRITIHFYGDDKLDELVKIIIK